MSTAYSLMILNNSSQGGTFCLYQTQEEGLNPLPLAWFAHVAYPSTRLLYEWNTDDYAFVWSETGPLQPGVLFTAKQTWPASLASGSRVRLTSKSGIFSFVDEPAGRPGSLAIEMDGTVPLNKLSVGLGMAGRPMLALQAQSNTIVQFTPRPRYWLTFGNYVQGQVLDPSGISNAVELRFFPPGTQSLSATLNSDLSWTVEPSYEERASLARER